MRLSARFEPQPELPATPGVFRFVFWLAVAVVIASTLTIGDTLIELPSRMHAD